MFREDINKKVFWFTTAKPKKGGFWPFKTQNYIEDLSHVITDDFYGDSFERAKLNTNEDFGAVYTNPRLLNKLADGSISSEERADYSLLANGFNSNAILGKLRNSEISQAVFKPMKARFGDLEAPQLDHNAEIANNEPEIAVRDFVRLLNMEDNVKDPDRKLSPSCRYTFDEALGYLPPKLPGFAGIDINGLDGLSDLNDNDEQFNSIINSISRKVKIDIQADESLGEKEMKLTPKRFFGALDTIKRVVSRKTAAAHETGWPTRYNLYYPAENTNTEKLYGVIKCLCGVQVSRLADMSREAIVRYPTATNLPSIEVFDQDRNRMVSATACLVASDLCHMFGLPQETARAMSDTFKIEAYFHMTRMENQSDTHLMPLVADYHALAVNAFAIDTQVKMADYANSKGIPADTARNFSVLLYANTVIKNPVREYADDPTPEQIRRGLNDFFENGHNLLPGEGEGATGPSTDPADHEAERERARDGGVTPPAPGVTPPGPGPRITEDYSDVAPGSIGGTGATGPDAGEGASAGADDGATSEGAGESTGAEGGESTEGATDESSTTATDTTTRGPRITEDYSAVTPTGATGTGEGAGAESTDTSVGAGEGATGGESTGGEAGESGATDPAGPRVDDRDVERIGGGATEPKSPEDTSTGSTDPKKEDSEKDEPKKEDTEAADDKEAAGATPEGPEAGDDAGASASTDGSATGPESGDSATTGPESEGAAGGESTSGESTEPGTTGPEDTASATSGEAPTGPETPSTTEGEDAEREEEPTLTPSEPSAEETVSPATTDEADEALLRDIFSRYFNQDAFKQKYGEQTLSDAEKQSIFAPFFNQDEYKTTYIEQGLTDADKQRAFAPFFNQDEYKTTYQQDAMTDAERESIMARFFNQDEYKTDYVEQTLSDADKQRAFAPFFNQDAYKTNYVEDSISDEEMSEVLNHFFGGDDDSHGSKKPPRTTTLDDFLGGDTPAPAEEETPEEVPTVTPPTPSAGEGEHVGGVTSGGDATKTTKTPKAKVVKPILKVKSPEKLYPADLPEGKLPKYRTNAGKECREFLYEIVMEYSVEHLKETADLAKEIKRTKDKDKKEELQESEALNKGRSSVGSVASAIMYSMIKNKTLDSNYNAKNFPRESQAVQEIDRLTHHIIEEVREFVSSNPDAIKGNSISVKKINQYFEALGATAYGDFAKTTRVQKIEKGRELLKASLHDAVYGILDNVTLPSGLESPEVASLRGSAEGKALELCGADTLDAYGENSLDASDSMDRY